MSDFTTAFILVANRDGKQSSSVESTTTRMKVFSSQAALDQWLLKHYAQIQHGNIRKEGNVQCFNAFSKSGHNDVIIIRKERVQE